MNGLPPTARELDVSRETMDRLNCFAELVQKWTPRINLVSRSSLAQLWTRHIKDSLQVVRAASDGARWADLGSGGGFPGLVAAIVGAQTHPDRHHMLVESDQRKSVFLRTVIRETGINCEVIPRRIEALDPLDADILSARALAELPQLLAYAERHLAADGTALFPKGATWQKELTAARREWRFGLDTITSETDADAVILKIRGVQRV